MQFIVIAKDATDDQALARRMAAREAHLALGNKMKEAGTLLYAAAALNDQQQMCGSFLVCQFESRAELDKWLNVEPYVLEKVWRDIDVVPCRVGPAFAKGL